MDRDNASFERTLEGIQKAFGRAAVPIAVPVGEGKAFKGVVDLVSGQARLYAEDASGKFQASETPAAQADTAKAWREKLVEMVAESNEELMEEFFEKGTLSQEQLAKGLRTAVGAGRIHPVLPVSSLLNVGVHAVLDAIVELLPSPADRGEAAGLAGKEAASRKPAADAPLSAFVWKTIVDPHAGRISLFRVYSGTLKSDSSVHNATRDTAERVGSLLLLQGKNQTQVPEIQAGDIGAVAKLKDTQTGDTLADKAHPIVYPEGRASRSRPRPSRSSPRRAATTTRSRSRCSGCWRRTPCCASRATPRPTRCCSRARASSTSRSWSDACASATRSRSTSRSPRSPTARRSRARPRRTAATRSRPAVTASSATARSA